ncbi:MAG: helix-turn-helix domain-containing protein [Roseinatronobacter sp.]
MSAVFESTDLAPTERLIMLALADHADDEGRCYPSIRRLCQRTGLSERAVQSNIKKLVDQGYIRTVIGGGKGNANLYFVSANPAADAPRTKCTPAADAPQTPQQMHPNPAADAPKPSRTTIEPSDLIPSAKPADILSEVSSPQAARSFVVFRSKIKKPLTETAARRIAKDLTKITSQGGDADDALGMAEERGWQAIKPDWYFKETSNDKRSGYSPRGHKSPAGEQLTGLAGAAVRRRVAREQGYEG